MTTHVSRERREAVAAALSLPTYSMTYDESLFLADAAIQAMLPDRAAFETLLAARDALIAKSEQPNINRWRFDRVCDQIDQNKAALIALVYGADDAQAGEVAE